MGKRNSLKNGNTFIGGTVPFGYDVKRKCLIPNDGEKKVLNRIFRMYRDGKSTVEIKNYLDSHTEYLPKRSKSGWNLGTIQKMLGNPLYKGSQKWEWKEVIGGKSKVVDTIIIKTPQIVPTKLWDEVQLKLIENQRNRNVEKKNISLLDGLIYCKSCGVRLSIKGGKSRTNHLYSCRSVEYKWKDPIRWGDKHKNCSLKKSLRIKETDDLILHHLINIIKESKGIRENYKVKNLHPKFDEVKNLKKELEKRTKYINEKKRVYKSYEKNLIDIEVGILTNQYEKIRGKMMIDKISRMMEDVNSEIQKLERELSVYQNSTNWIDWLNQMFLEVESVKGYSLENQQKFLNQYLEKVNVEYLETVKSHKLEFEFKYPIVDDKLSQFGVDKEGKRTYQVEDGSKTSTFVVPISNSYKSKVGEEEKEELDRLISKLKVENSLSLNEISKELNDRGYRTPTNKIWNKSNLSIYIKRMKVDVGK